MTQYENTQAQFDDVSMDTTSAELELTETTDGADDSEEVVNGFAALQLNPALLRAVESLGYTDPTPVQAQTIPHALNGGDWMVSSQTGSGKTAAFLLPAIHALLATPPMSKGEEFARKRRAGASPRVLILAPTRELAQQVAAEAIRLVRFCKGVRIANVVGGTAFGKQLQDLRGATLVVATPGRLLDLNRNGQIDLNAVQTLVVDEADRMLDLGFSEDLEAIHVATAKRDRTMMFSATFAPRIMELASHVMRNAQKIELASAHDMHENIEQRLHWFDDMAHKQALLEHYLHDEKMEQAIVFAATQVEADELSEDLREAGYSASALHGAMPQALRNRRIKSLRDGTVKILVATDVAARGIDVPTISHVINYGLPMKPEDYVHRIGRTGRAGRDGLAVTLAGARDRYRIRNIEMFTQRRLNAAVVPGHEPQTNPHLGAPRGGRRGFSERRDDRAPRFDRAERSERPSFSDGAPALQHSESRFDSRQPAQTETRAASPWSSSERSREPARSAYPDRASREFAPSHHERSERFDTPQRERFQTERGDRAERHFGARPRWDDRAPHAAGERSGSPERRDFRGSFDGDAQGSFRRESRASFAERGPSSFGRRDTFHKPHDRAAPRFDAPVKRPRPAEDSGEREFNRERPQFAHQSRAERRGDKPAGPAFTPPAEGGNRAARRAHLHAQYEARLAGNEA